MKRWITAAALGLVALPLTACGNGGEQTAASAPAAAGAESGTQGMAGMSGVGEMGGDMMRQMQSHMQAMQGLGADSLQRMLPAHRQMTANMLAEMNAEMRRMNMPADPAWNATVDSLRSDLIRMPEMSAAELKRYLPGHEARVRRLMAQHQQMMGAKKM